MQFTVWIEPHERHEAMDAYRERLTEEQREQIADAPESALICMIVDARGTTIKIIEDG